MNARPTLGLIGTGQGPRPEYIRFHQELLHRLDVEANVIIRHALDGLTLAEIEALAPGPKAPAIHSYVRVPGRVHWRFGADWGEAWLDLARIVPLVQACIEELEAEGADVVIWCCTEALPDGALRCSKPVVFPSSVMLGYGEAIATSVGPTSLVWILAQGSRQRAEQLKTWRRPPWACDLNIRFHDLGSAPLEAAAKLAEVKPRPDLILYWGYGTGLASGDPPHLMAQLESSIGAPVVLPHVASTLFARNLLFPSLRATSRGTVERMLHDSGVATGVDDSKGLR